jgi:aryl-alcohol dehydrogenase-like predicted oxidoreductase
VTVAQVALAWLLRRPAVTSLIVGARTEEQLRDNLAALNLQLTAEEHQRLERVSRPTLIYPFWRQRNTPADRLGIGDRSLITPVP